MYQEGSIDREVYLHVYYEISQSKFVVRIRKREKKISLFNRNASPDNVVVAQVS